jgi:hypothetical protein
MGEVSEVAEKSTRLMDTHRLSRNHQDREGEAILYRTVLGILGIQRIHDDHRVC